MTDAHISRATLETYVKRELPVDELERVDTHVAACELCGLLLRDITPLRSGLLEAVRVERRRHLTFDELEAVVDKRSATDVDALARQHLSECKGCQQEVADLEAFEAVWSAPAPVADQVRAASAKPRPFWRILFSPPLALAAGVAMAVLLFVVIPRLQTGNTPAGTPGNPIQVAVRLQSGTAADRGERIRSFSATGRGRALTDSILRSVQEASRLAATTGQAQTIRISVPRNEYQQFTNAVSALGRVESEAGPADGAVTPGATSSEPLTVSLTILPEPLGQPTPGGPNAR